VLDFVQDGAAVAFVPKRRARVREREEDSLFERSEIFSQVVYIVYNYASRCKCVLSNAALSSKRDLRGQGGRVSNVVSLLAGIGVDKRRCGF
jgi:hypothetical protein